MVQFVKASTLKIFYLIFFSCTGLYAETVVIKKADGVVLEKTCDQHGRLIRLSSSDGSIFYSYAYDDLGHLCEAYDHITGLSTCRSYDTSGRLTSETLPSGLVLSRTYDAEGNPVSLYFPDGSFVTYEYDSLYLRSIHRYDKEGRNLYTHQYTSYDAERHFLSQELIGNLGSVDSCEKKVSSPFLHQEVVAYDSRKNISCLMDNETLREFFYDEKDQLIKETGEISHIYTYDATDKADVLTYDLNGNPIFSSDGSCYTYDALNRLLAVEGRGGKSLFTYDAYHRCVSKTTVTATSQETLFFLYDNQNEIGAVNSSGNIVELRILAPRAPAEASMGIAFELYGKIYAPIYDLFGNVSQLIPLDSSSPIDFFKYNAFGEETPSPSKNPWRFSSKRYDKESQLYFFGRRFYHPFLRRWLTPDPAGFIDGPNLYAYVHNNPYAYIDLQGLQSHSRLSFLGSRLSSFYKALGFFPNSPQEELCTYNLGNDKESHIFFINGINNTFEETQNSAQAISALAEGSNIHGTYSPTKGFFKDGVGYFKKFKRPRGSSTKALKNQIDNHLLEYPDQPILIVCHSNGAVITKKALSLLDEESRKKVSVVAIAPGAFIPEDLCQSVHHYESEHDFVPRLDKKGRKKAKKNIITLKKHPKAPLFDHSFVSPTYKEALEEEIHKHLLPPLSSE